MRCHFVRGAGRGLSARDTLTLALSHKGRGDPLASIHAWLRLTCCLASARLALHPTQFWETKNRPRNRDGVTNNRGATLIRRPLARNGLCWTRKGKTAKSHLASPAMSRTMITASIPAQAYGVRSRSFAAALSVGGSRVHSAPSPTPVFSASGSLDVACGGVLLPLSACIVKYSERGARAVKRCFGARRRFVRIRICGIGGIFRISFRLARQSRRSRKSRQAESGQAPS